MNTRLEPKMTAGWQVLPKAHQTVSPYSSMEDYLPTQYCVGTKYKKNRNIMSGQNILTGSKLCWEAIFPVVQV